MIIETCSSLAPHLSQRSGASVALVDKGSGQTLRTAAAVLPVKMTVEDPNEVFGAYVDANATAAGRRRLLTVTSALAPNNDLVYATSIATTDVIQVCTCTSMWGAIDAIKRLGSSPGHLPV
jgi:hypothetical protein